MLTKYGYEVRAPEEFENILDYVKSEKPHLILLDINLPVFDGFYICRELRKTLNIPIIIVTSRNSDMDELMSINLGADDFVTKPYNTQILLARISSVLKRTYNDMDNMDILTYKDLKLNLSKGSIEAFGHIGVETKNKIYTENKGMTTTALFIGIYLGIVFLISSMAVLSLQQLSEASDSIERYKSLKRIGANDKMINKTIFV
ncbi:response regulator [Romboutsia sedimentorum]|uniref:response regulator n=1 Tax=Romboutsia sedimentorum TaxID=1368474 RepID=UPI002F41808D